MPTTSTTGSDTTSLGASRDCGTPTEERDPAGSTILVVGDRAAERAPLLDVLDSGGYRTLTADSGPGGLDLVREDAPDLVICAVLMPGMDGFEFVEALRADPRTAATRVVFWSATFSEHDIRGLASACGVAHLLCAPCVPDAVLATVREELATRTELRWPMGAADARHHVRVLNETLLEQVAAREAAERHATGLMTLVSVMEKTFPAALAMLDADFRIVNLNDAFARLHGTPLEEQIGRSLTGLVPGLAERLEDRFHALLDSREPTVNVTVEGTAPGAPDHERCWLASMYPMQTDGGAFIGVGLLLVDITERRTTEALRTAVMEHMVEGVLVCDPDGTISYVNAGAADMLGWPADELCGRSVDVVAAGDESSPAGVCHRSEPATDGSRSAQVDGAFTRRDGSVFPVEFSVAPLPAGRVVTGCVTVFRDVSDEKAEDLRVQRELEQLAWLGRIRDALTEDRFELHGQPVVRLDSGTVGEEMLIRMRLPSGELAEPDAFLPVAERFGLIVDIDRWVIAHALRLARPDWIVGINLSGRSVGDPTLPAFISSQLEASGADPRTVVFEITETALMENLDAGQVLAEWIASVGSGLALDDFGTGFGSFTYLKRLPLRFLKIDAEFVSELTTHPANRHLVKATVGLARDFGYETVAEGIEDEETLEIVKSLGVDYGQG